MLTFPTADVVILRLCEASIENIVSADEVPSCSVRVYATMFVQLTGVTGQANVRRVADVDDMSYVSELAKAVGVLKEQVVPVAAQLVEAAQAEV